MAEGMCWATSLRPAGYATRAGTNGSLLPLPRSTEPWFKDVWTRGSGTPRGWPCCESNRMHRHDPPDEFGHTHALPQRFGTHRVDEVLGRPDGGQPFHEGTC